MALDSDPTAGNVTVVVLEDHCTGVLPVLVAGKFGVRPHFDLLEAQHSIHHLDLDRQARERLPFVQESSFFSLPSSG